MTAPAESGELKRCCAALYESDFARMLLGDSFHPGGLRLTARLGGQLGLRPGLCVLDVASGKGESAIFLAGQFGCHVVGVDFGPENVREANARAEAAQVAHLVSFVEGDAERLGFSDASFDAVICECAFCTFPDKRAGASEFARVLRPGGGVGLSDLTRSGPLPEDLDGLLAWIACIADARPVEEYASYLEAAGFGVTTIEPQNNALAEMARDVQGRLLGLELMARLNRVDLPGADFEQAKHFARAASKAIQQGLLGYSLIVARVGTILQTIENGCS
jgi:SAM-dependent methyltransferase